MPTCNSCAHTIVPSAKRCPACGCYYDKPKTDISKYQRGGMVMAEETKPKISHNTQIIIALGLGLCVLLGIMFLIKYRKRRKLNIA